MPRWIHTLHANSGPHVIPHLLGRGVNTDSGIISAAHPWQEGGERSCHFPDNQDHPDKTAHTWIWGCTRPSKPPKLGISLVSIARTRSFQLNVVKDCPPIANSARKKRGDVGALTMCLDELSVILNLPPITAPENARDHQAKRDLLYHFLPIKHIQEMSIPQATAMLSGRRHARLQQSFFRKYFAELPEVPDEVGVNMGSPTQLREVLSQPAAITATIELIFVADSTGKITES
ncbi:hypothetical protein BD779DRAFT_1480145 [Infundibulicybe gibba]|nr:hypothetical protein BD779DRAFT_1480145 [Infundibulicybe gibba]